MQESLITALLKAGVNVTIGVVEEFNAWNTGFKTGWVRLVVITDKQDMSAGCHT
jgi:hypothetical protein